jgi:hypothetical protein
MEEIIFWLIASITAICFIPAFIEVIQKQKERNKRN